MIIDAIMRANGNAHAESAMNNALSDAEEKTRFAYDKAEKYQQPYADQGGQYYKTLGGMIGRGQFNMPTEDFSYGSYQNQPFNFQADPSYQFRINEGMNAIQGSAAAKGSALSGATMKALQKYGQNMASQEYGNAYNRYTQDRSYNRGNYENDRNFAYDNFTGSYTRRQNNLNNQYNMYSNMANTGVNAANNLGNLATARGNTLADLAMQRGNVAAQKGIADSTLGDQVFNLPYKALGAYLSAYSGGM